MISQNSTTKHGHKKVTYIQEFILSVTIVRDTVTKNLKNFEKKSYLMHSKTICGSTISNSSYDFQVASHFQD